MESPETGVEVGDPGGDSETDVREVGVCVSEGGGGGGGKVDQVLKTSLGCLGCLTL